MAGKSKLKFKSKSKSRSKSTRKSSTRGAGTKKSKSSSTSKALMRPTIAYHADALPRIMVTKFCFADAGTLSTNAFGTVNSAVTYRVNSPYDPTYAAGGSSCQGWGIASTYYGNYIVTGAYINVTFSDPSADGFYVGLRFRQNSDNTPVGENLIQLKTAQQTPMQALNNSGNQVKTFSYFIRPWTLMSRDKASYMNDAINSSATNNNPSNDNCLFDLFCINQNTSAQTVNYMIEIKYVTKLWNRVII